MHDKIFAFFDAAIVGVPVIGFCIWQLISVNREIKQDGASKDAARHPIGKHGLDDGRSETP